MKIASEAQRHYVHPIIFKSRKPSVVVPAEDRERGERRRRIEELRREQELEEQIDHFA